MGPDAPGALLSDSLKSGVKTRSRPSPSEHTSAPTHRQGDTTSSIPSIDYMASCHATGPAARPLPPQTPVGAGFGRP